QNELVAEAFASGPDRRARSNRIWTGVDVRLRAHCEKRCVRKTGPRLGQKIFSRGQKLPAQLRTIRRRLSFAMPRRSGHHAPSIAAKGIRKLAEDVHAADSGRSRRRRKRGMAEGRRLAR